MAILGVIADDFTGATDLAGCWFVTACAPSRRSACRRGAAIPGCRRRRRGAEDAHDPGHGRDRAVAGRASTGCSGGGQASSYSSTARPSIRPTPATSARSPTRCSMRSTPSRRSTIRPSRRTAAPSLGPSVRGRHPVVRLHMRHHPLTPMTDSTWCACWRARPAQGRAGAAGRCSAGRRPCARRRRAFSRRCAPRRGRRGGRHDLGTSAQRSATTLVTGGSGMRSACPPPTAAAEFWPTRPMPTRCPRSPAPPPCWRAPARRRPWDRSRPSRARTCISIPTPSAAASRSAMPRWPGPRTRSAMDRSCCRPATNPKR